MILLVLFVVFVIFGFIYYLKQNRLYKKVEHIPGPRILPFIGNLLEFGTNTVEALLNLRRLSDRYGPIVRLCIGSNVCILLTEPKYIAQVLNSSDTSEKPGFYKFIKFLLGDGLVTSNGDVWHRHKRLIAPTFSNKHLEKYMATFNKNTNELVGTLKGLVNFGTTDATEYILDWSLNNICNSTMQVNITDNKEYRKAYSEVLDTCINRFFSPLTQINFLYQFTNEYKLFQRNLKITRDFTNTVISQRKKEIVKRTESSERLSLLDHLLHLSEKDAFTDKEIQDEVQTFIVAGGDTIACTMSLGLFELAKHSEVQKKILEETNHILGTNPNADISFEDVHDFKYTECVFKEMLRYHAPGPLIMRKLRSEMKFDNLIIPAGAYVMIFITGTHFSDRNFPNPEKFDPERHTTENCKNIHQYAFIPFSGGPRICIGQKYAMLAAKVMLAKLIRNFEILPVEPQHKLKLALSGTLKCTNGLPLRLVSRQIP